MKSSFDDDFEDELLVVEQFERDISPEPTVAEDQTSPDKDDGPTSQPNSVGSSPERGKESLSSHDHV